VSNRLAVLAAVLVLALVAAAPALAQDEVPACVIHDACLNQSEEQEATADQYTESPQPAQEFPVTPASEMECEGDSTNPCSPNQGVTQSDNARYAAVPEAAFDAPASCGSCGLQVAQGALDAITGDGSGVTDSASEEAGTPVEDTAIYRAAFEAAKEAGADDETAKEAAKQAVAEANSGKAAKGKASKVRKGGSGKDAAEDKVRKNKTRKDKAREDGSSEEETTEDADEEVAASEDANGSGGEDTVTTPADSRSPLLLGGLAFLSVGGFAALRVARSWSSSDLRRLPRN
jgi:hypothetical protein